MKKALVRWKIYMDRSRGYAAMLQFVAIMYVSINTAFENRHLKPSWIVIIGIVSAIILALLIVGRYDYKWGFIQEEARRHSELNPVMMEVVNDLKKIKEQLKIE